MFKRMTKREFIVGAAAALGLGCAALPLVLASRIRRRSAVFKSIAEARKVLSATFDVTHVDMLIGALQPTIAFRPDLAGTLPALGATRIGGTPDLARDTAWPIRAVPANL